MNQTPKICGSQKLLASLGVPRAGKDIETGRIRGSVARDAGRNIRHGNMSICYDRSARIIHNTGNAPSSVLRRHFRPAELAQCYQQLKSRSIFCQRTFAEDLHLAGDARNRAEQGSDEWRVGVANGLDLRRV